MNWKGCPSTLQIIYLNTNQITEMNWRDCPPTLQEIILNNNNNNNRVTNKEWSYENYKMALKIAKVYKIHYNKRIKAAKIITRGCHNWVWKPICKDGRTKA